MKAGSRTQYYRIRRMLKTIYGARAQYRGRSYSFMSMIRRSPSIVDDIEERVEAAEGQLDSARNLERAGRRRDREADREALWEELKEFDKETPVASGKLSLDDFEEPAQETKKEAPEPEQNH